MNDAARPDKQRNGHMYIYAEKRAEGRKKQIRKNKRVDYTEIANGKLKKLDVHTLRDK